MVDTIEDLRARLERAERQLQSARMIDDWPRCQSETAFYQGVVAGLVKQLQEAEAGSSDVIGVSILRKHGGEEPERVLEMTVELAGQTAEERDRMVGHLLNEVAKKLNALLGLG